MAQPIFLTGMMGSGKSSVGRALAEATDAVFVDLDTRIGRMFGISIEELFADGEARFRACERLALQTLVAEPGFAARKVVTATGGGIVTDSANLATMHAVGLTVFLDVPLHQLVARLAASGADDRPLIGDARDLEGTLSRLLAARRSAYAACSLCVSGEGKVDDVVRRVDEAVRGIDGR